MTRRRKAERLLDRDQAQYVIACFRNAGELLMDANLLHGNRKYARAFALAVVAGEELGKALLAFFTSAKIGVDPAHHHRVVRSHTGKQGVARELTPLAELIRVAWQTANRRYREMTLRRSPRNPTVRRMEAVAYGLHIAIGRMKDSDKVVGLLPRKHSGHALMQSDNLQSLKNACLYVDTNVADGVKVPWKARPRAKQIREYLDAAFFRYVCISSWLIEVLTGRDQTKVRESLKFYAQLWGIPLMPS